MAKDSSIPGVDLGWIEELTDLTPELREKVRESVIGKVKDLHRGMTRAQQEAAESRQAAEEARKWKDWADDGNQPYLQDWRRLKPWLDRYGEVDKIIDVLAGNNAPALAQTAREQATQAEKEVTDLFETGELDWDKAKGLIHQIRKELQEFQGALSSLQDLRDREIPEYVQQFQNSLELVQKSTVNQMAGLVPIIFDAIKYQVRFPERDSYGVLQEMSKSRHARFEEAANALYGEEDTEKWQQKERDRIRAEERETLRREKETKDGSGEAPVTPSPTSVFKVRDETGKRVALRNPMEFNKAVLERVQKAGL